MFGGNRMKLEEYKNRYYYGKCVCRIDKPHDCIKYSRPIEVWYEDIINDGRESRFLLFDDGEFVTNTLTFPCDIAFNDVERIAKDLLDEFLKMGDFEDLDRELNGKCACKEYEEKYKSCDECPLYHDKENGCLGATYSLPSHANVWTNTEEKWNKIYGNESENYKRYKIKVAKEAMRQLAWAVRGDKKFEKEALKETIDSFKRVIKR